MSNFDKDRYASLIARASFDCSFYKGTFQDQSKSRLAMSAVGTPGWSQVNGLPALTHTADTQGCRSAAVAAVVDCLGAFFVELLFKEDRYSTLAGQWIVQYNNGGWDVVPDEGNTRLSMRLYTNAGAVARTMNTAVGSVQVRRVTHAILAMSNSGLAGASWINGVPTVVSFINAGVPAAVAGVATFTCAGNWQDRNTNLAMRVWQGTPTNEDVSALYGAAKSMVGEI